MSHAGRVLLVEADLPVLERYGWFRLEIGPQTTVRAGYFHSLPCLAQTSRFETSCRTPFYSPLVSSRRRMTYSLIELATTRRLRPILTLWISPFCMS